MCPSWSKYAWYPCIVSIALCCATLWKSVYGYCCATWIQGMHHAFQRIVIIRVILSLNFLKGNECPCYTVDRPNVSYVYVMDDGLLQSD